jgi:hypothetical protein
MKGVAFAPDWKLDIASMQHAASNQDSSPIIRHHGVYVFTRVIPPRIFE